MQQVNRHAHYSKASFVAAALFVSLSVLFIFPMAANAQQAPVPESAQKAPADENYVVPNDTDPTTIDQSNPVKTPGTPVATSPITDGSIDWEWTLPEGGVTPDAPTEQPTEPTDPETTPDPAEVPAEPQPPVVQPAPAEHATDIIKYGYELTRYGTVYEQGTIASTETKVTTNVRSSGDYMFKLWSITRENRLSDIAYGYFTVVLPVVTLPTYPVISIPKPIEDTLVATAEAATDNSLANSYYYSSAQTPAITSNRSVANNTVASTANTSGATNVQATTIPVVKASDQGWMILGLPWYVWLLAAAVGFTAWRWTRMTLHEKE
jgi:hypothetical protein